MNTLKNLALHRFALFVSAATFILVTAGASVTSTGSGLAVPDWPLSYGTLFPEMVGGVVFEHGHRMIAGVVLILTIILAVWIFKREERPWVRRTAFIALTLLFVQAALGGITVLLKLPTLVSVSHAGLAQAFFCLIVTLTLVTSQGWHRPPDVRVAADRTRVLSLATLAIVTTAAIYIQIILGALMRHTGAGLAIPDFPLAYGGLVPPYFTPPIAIHYAHRVGAAAVSVLVVLVIAQIFRHHRGNPYLARPASWLTGFLLLQLLLGALTIWTKRSVVPTTFHVAVGAAVLASSLVLALRARRLLHVGQDRAIRVATSLVNETR